jgi:hypothetical protein
MKLDILSNLEEVEEIGNEDGVFKTKKAVITAKNTPYIFSLLSKIYKNPEGSIVREITSNCFDAHKKAKKDNEPVIIRLFVEDTGNKYIEFHDNGTGISPELMDDVYMSYGESDKRDSDDFIGAFGLGSKSPFSITDYFYVITKSNGIEYTYLLNSTVAGPEYTTLNERQYDELLESSGTIIRIPVKNDIEIWTRNIKSQLKYFTDVFVDGFNVNNDFKIKKFKTFKIREDLFLANPVAALHLSIGDVTYPISWEELQETQINFNGALMFNIGELNVIPNREEVEYKESTKTKIKNKLQEFRNELSELVLDKSNFQVDNLQSYFEFSKKLIDNKIIVNINILDGIIVNLNLAYNLKFIQSSNIFYTLLIDNNNVKINNNRISPSKYFDIKLIRKSCQEGYKFFKFNDNDRNSQFLSSNFFTNPNNRQKILFDLENKNLKKYQRSYVNDVLINDHKYYVFYNIKLHVKEIIKDIIKNNVHSNFNLKTSINTITFLKQFFTKKIQEDLLINCTDFSTLNIPEDCRKEKRASISKEDGTILTYRFDGNSFQRKETEQKDFTQINNISCIYGSFEDKDKLEKCKTLLDYSVNIFYCAKKYFKFFEQNKKLFVHVNNLHSKDNIITTNKKVVDFIKRYYSYQLLVEQETNFPKFFQKNYSFDNGKDFKNKLFNDLIKIERFFYSNSQINYNSRFNISFIDFLDKSFTDVIKQRARKISEKKLFLIEQYNKFQQDFMIELSCATYGGLNSNYEMMNQKIIFSLQNKKLLLHKYLLTINKQK